MTINEWLHFCVSDELIPVGLVVGPKVKLAVSLTQATFRMPPESIAI